MAAPMGCSLAGGGLVHGVADRCAGSRGVGDGVGHEVAGEFVVPLGKGNGEFGGAAARANQQSAAISDRVLAPPRS